MTASGDAPVHDPDDRDVDGEAGPLLELTGVRAAYGRIEVLHGVDLCVMPGTVVALLGPNGAGKTTTLKAAGGQMRPTAGCVHIAGRHVNGAKPDALVLVAFEETTKIIPQLIAKGIGPEDIQIYFVDGNLADYSQEKFDLTGVKGTLPVSGDPDPGFNDRLLEIDDSLKDFSYGPQSYDATMIIALAAIAADDDSGEAVGAEIINVTKEGTQCSTFEECAGMLEAGEDIDYEGASGPTDMNDTGSPASGTIGINLYDGNKYKQVDQVSGLVE